MSQRTARVKSKAYRLNEILDKVHLRRDSSNRQQKEHHIKHASKATKSI